MRKIARIAGCTILGLVVATTLVEIALHLTVASALWRVLPVPEVAVYGPDRFTGYRHRPNVRGVWLQENRSWIETSSLGLRDRERQFARSEAPRAVVVGNSVLEALQVELPQTAVFVAEQRLQDRHKDAEVINLGLAGANPPVIIARLQTLGVSLKPDLAVVILPVSNLDSSQMTDDSNFTGYRRDTDGQFTLHYSFRNTRGYRFRTSHLGDLFYWLLDHSAVMRIINSRMNGGWFAEWPRAAKRDDGSANCFNARIPSQLALWRDHRPERADMLLQAFIRDLSKFQSEHRIPTVVAITTMRSGCPEQADERRAAIAAMDARLKDAGIRMVDLDGLIADRVGAANVRPLYGFKNRLGSGHLNVTGNRVFGELLADIIADALPTR